MCKLAVQQIAIVVTDRRKMANAFRSGKGGTYHFEGVVKLTSIYVQPMISWRAWPKIGWKGPTFKKPRAGLRYDKRILFNAPDDTRTRALVNYPLMRRTPAKSTYMSELEPPSPTWTLVVARLLLVQKIPR